MDRPRIVLGSDEDTSLIAVLLGRIAALGRNGEARLVGAPWPRVGRVIGEAVASGEAVAGIVCCWTGTGVSIAANKIPGVRAALCVDAETAIGARRFNDANVLALSLRLTTETVATEILEAFLSTGPDPEAAADAVALERGSVRR